MKAVSANESNAETAFIFSDRADPIPSKKRFPRLSDITFIPPIITIQKIRIKRINQDTKTFSRSKIRNVFLIFFVNRIIKPSGRPLFFAVSRKDVFFYHEKLYNSVLPPSKDYPVKKESARSTHLRKFP